MSGRFALDKDRAKLMGVCAGLARMTGSDLFLVRLGVVALSLFLAPATILLYFIIAWIAPERG